MFEKACGAGSHRPGSLLPDFSSTHPCQRSRTNGFQRFVSWVNPTKSLVFMSRRLRAHCYNVEGTHGRQEESNTHDI